MSLLTCKSRVSAGFCRAEGVIKNVNTAEEYRTLDKGFILSQAARTVSLTNHATYRFGFNKHYK